ncbi:MAG: ATP-binding protein [Ferrovibrio sp.]|nr:ATP-binding protein [Ferrovibrio sp.]
MSFEYVNPEDGFTSSIITDPKRFVGRAEVIEKAIIALRSPQSLIAVYGKRGVGKSSVLRQIQQMAIGDYSVAVKTGIGHLIPDKPRTYYTVYYSCDSMIGDTKELLIRMCNDTDTEDGLLRLVPDKGKQLSEFSRSLEDNAGVDLKVIKWGAKETDGQKYSSAVPSDPVQTFRNFVNAVVDHNNSWWRKRDGVLILLDEFDVLKNKEGLGSLFKSLTSDRVKFAICGIGQDISALMFDHKSVGRLVEQGAIHVRPMPQEEIKLIFKTAEELFKGVVKFDESVVNSIYKHSEGYPYFAQLIGRACVEMGNKNGTNYISEHIFSSVLENIRNGTAIPTLEDQYQLAVGEATERAVLLTLLAEQSAEATQYNEDIGRVVLKNSRGTAQELGVEYVDQLIGRLVDERFGPALMKSSEQRGVYEFIDPVFRAYVKLRRLS